MNSFHKLLKMFCVTVILTFSASCELTELDLTKDPNNLDPAEADADLLLNGVQKQFGFFVANIQVEPSEVVRMINMDGRNYRNAIEPTRFNPEWRRAYRQIINNIRVLTAIAEQDDFFHHIGIAQVVEAYTIITLVDLFGDIPYSEALNTENLNPKLDAGASVYAAAEALLDSAVTNFGKETLREPNDFFYGGNWGNWVKAANSVKMKMYVATRLVDDAASTKFAAIVESGEFIGNNAEDFQFEWGTSNANPNTRNPRYTEDYTPSGANNYMSNWLMDYMYRGKGGNPDPRMRYYFYRQVPAVPQDNPNLINCVGKPKPPSHYGNGVFCSLPEGYWGRDHGDDDGIPPDSQRRTAYGLYPIGGKFDEGSFRVISSTEMGARGGGITPIMLASWVDIMRAEMAMVGAEPGDATQLLLSGVRKSFQKVRDFGSRDLEADLSKAPAIILDGAYVNELESLFSAADTNDKWDILGSEYFVALFGNGIDAFNFYRRTGRPSTLQPNLEEDPGAFFRSFYYPTNSSERNANIDQKEGVTDKVFWDTGVDLLAN